MHPPCTIIVDSFLPSMRGLIAHELRRRKMSQGRIASILGITQPAVSQCLSKSANSHKRRLKELGMEEQEVDRYVSILCEDILHNPVEGVQTFLSICRGSLSRGYLCAAHRRRAPFLARCDACMKVLGTTKVDDAKGAVLDQLERAARMVSASPSFTAIMPEVSVNLVMAMEGATGEGEVAGFPGRIVRVKDRAQVSMSPDFGASHHMAQMLLTAMRFDPEIRAAINVKYDPKIEVKLAEMGLGIGRTVRVDGDAKVDDVVVASLAVLGEANGSIPPVVVDEGSKGIEPMTYLFGRDATSVAERAMALSKLYAHS